METNRSRPARRITVLSDHLHPLQPASVASVPTLDERAILKQRGGSILRQDHILKSDHFPALFKLPQLIAGVPNLRTVRCGRVTFVGCSQPTAAGLADLLASLPPGPKLWLNCRSEPVVYLDGRPFSLKREPFKHLSWPCDVAAVEESERALLDELEEERARRGCVLVHEESEDGSVFGERRSPAELRTVRDVFADVDFFVRWPVDDECAPSESALDELAGRLKRLAATGQEVTVLCNCHQGRGRTTTTLVLAHALLVDREVEAKEHGADELVRAVKVTEKARRRAEAAVEAFGQMLHLKESLLEKRRKRKGREAREGALRFAYVLLFAHYAEERRDLGFSQWMREQQGLTEALREVARRAEV